MSRLPTLRRQVIGAFAVFTFVVAALFGTFALLFTYAVEDRFFVDVLESEAALQKAHRQRSGSWLPPRGSQVSLHESSATLPADLRARIAEQPLRSEHAGEDGRHYHLLRIDAVSPDPSSALLVAEVSQQLVVRRMRGEMLRILGWAMLGVVAIGMLIGYWLARRTAAPLAALAGEVASLQLDEAPRLAQKAGGCQEIDTLARAFDTLAGRVREFVVREREFTVDASHELRTPLAVIQSACERLASEPLLSLQAHRQVEFLRRSVGLLQETLTTLLAMAREENSASKPEPVILLPMLEELIVERSVLLEGKPVEVVLDVGEDDCLVASPLALRLVLSNLIGNAFAHTAGGRVQIGFETGRLHIVNSGQMDSPATSADARGGGIGLAIVRRLCERHDIGLRLDAGAATIRVVLGPAPAEPPIDN